MHIHSYKCSSLSCGFRPPAYRKVKPQGQELFRRPLHGKKWLRRNSSSKTAIHFIGLLPQHLPIYLVFCLRLGIEKMDRIIFHWFSPCLLVLFLCFLTQSNAQAVSPSVPPAV